MSSFAQGHTPTTYTGQAQFQTVPEGFYWLSGPIPEEDTCLVRVYHSPDVPGEQLSGQLGVGCGIWDGSAWIPMSGLHDNCVFTSTGLEYPK